MKVLIVSCVFPPEPLISAQTSAQIAEELSRCGDEVVVVAQFPSRPAGKLYPGYARKLFGLERSPAGFIIRRCFSFFSARSNAISRFLENISFGFTSGWVVLTAPRPDVIYSNTWPIFATGIVFGIARLRGIPVVVSIQDIYPESLVLQGRISATGLPARFMRFLDGIIARGCAGVIVIGNTFADVYRTSRGLTPEHLHVVHNWVDEKNVVPYALRISPFRAQLDIPRESLLVAYGGNIGMASGVKTAIEAFSLLRDRNDIYFLVAGQGSQLSACERLAGKMGLTRVIFHTPWPAVQTSEVLGAADILLLPTRGRQSSVSVPSKLVTYMLASRPVLALALAQSELAVMVSKSGCGWIIEPDNPEKLAARLREIASDPPAERERKGTAGREFALKHLTAQACLPTIMALISNAARQD